MPDESTLIRELLELLARHGVRGLPEAASSLEAEAPVSRSSPTAVPVPTNLGGVRPPGTRASYISEIVTGDVGFDEDVLNRVSTMLSRGTSR